MSGLITKRELSQELQNELSQTVKVSPNMPSDQPVGGIWFETGVGDTSTSGGGITIKNSVVSDDEPDNNEMFWMDI